MSGIDAALFYRVLLAQIRDAHGKSFREPVGSMLATIVAGRVAFEQG